MSMSGDRSSLFTWRRLCILQFGLLLTIFVFNILPRTSFDSVRPLPLGTATKASHETITDYDTQDSLDEEECLSHFPEQAFEIERALNYWQGNNHIISADDLTVNPDGAGMRIIIHENEMRILESRHAVDPIMSSPDRALGVLHLFQRALDTAMALGERLPTVEINFNFRDDAEPPNAPGNTHSYWSFARTIGNPSHDRAWLMPNFDFWFYGPTGSFGDAKRKAMQHDAPYSNKIPKVVWRGNAGFNEGVRGSLVDVSTNKSWADIKHVSFNEDPPVAMDPDQFCKYAMTVYTEGVTYSGRLKFLMNCQSLLLVHEPEYATHYSHLLQATGPQQNYVLVKRDWSDLEEKVKHYLAHPAEAETIIENSLRTFRSKYTTRAALSCYIRRSIHAYGSVSYTPEIHKPMINGDGQQLRGVSYEQFLDKPADRSFE